MNMNWVFFLGVAPFIHLDLKVLSSQAGSLSTVSTVWFLYLQLHEIEPVSLRNDLTLVWTSSWLIVSRPESTWGRANGANAVPRNAKVGTAVIPGPIQPSKPNLSGWWGSFHSSRVLPTIHRRSDELVRSSVAKISSMIGRAVVQSGHHGAVKSRKIGISLGNDSWWWLKVNSRFL